MSKFRRRPRFARGRACFSTQTRLKSVIEFLMLHRRAVERDQDYIRSFIDIRDDDIRAFAPILCRPSPENLAAAMG
jgi:hypothetical protein